MDPSSAPEFAGRMRLALSTADTPARDAWQAVRSRAPKALPVVRLACQEGRGNGNPKAVAPLKLPLFPTSPHTICAIGHYCLHREILRLKDDGGWPTLSIVTRYAKKVPKEYKKDVENWLNRDD